MAAARQLAGPLRAAVWGLYFSFEQVAQLAVRMAVAGAATAAGRRSAEAKVVELVITLYGRTVDVGGFSSADWQLESAGCPPAVREQLAHRLGWKHFWSPAAAAGRYALALNVLDEHNVAEMLIALAINEPGEHLASMMLDGAAMEGLPDSWLADLPFKGELLIEYTDGQGRARCPDGEWSSNDPIITGAAFRSHCADEFRVAIASCLIVLHWRGPGGATLSNSVALTPPGLPPAARSVLRDFCLAGELAYATEAAAAAAAAAAKGKLEDWRVKCKPAAVIFIAFPRPFTAFH